jgi:tetratricopeptide (TPR) repeat protein
MEPRPEIPAAQGPFPIAPAPYAAAIEGAARLLERRTQETPSYPDLWNRMGLYFAAIGALEEAIGCFERALAINPRFLGALENRAWCALAAGDGFAWRRFEESSELLRLHPGVRHHLQLFATARFESLERALVMSSMPPQGRYEAAHLLDRMWLLAALGRTQEARILVEDVTCSDPALRGAFATAGLLEAHHAAPNTPEGESAWERWRAAYAFNPQLAEVCGHTARWCQKDGELKDSRELVDWTLTLSLDLPSFWVNLALHHEAAGESHRTLPCLERAVAANPQHRRARKELALWLGSHGRAREAVAHWETLREVAPNYADVRFHLGLLYLDRGDLDAAGNELTAALAANPRYTRAALNLARVRFEQHRWAEARAGYERVLTDGLDSCEIQTALAEVYDRLGEPAEAEQAFTRAARLDPDDAGLLRARADWRERNSKPAEAADDRARLDEVLRQHSSLDQAA